jgi:hypothetical protein
MRWTMGLCVVSGIAAVLVAPTKAAGLVPGTGTVLTAVGDQFEDPNWEYTFNLPKGSADVDQQLRRPFGYSNNRRWYEGTDRGQPDFVKRVPTPEGGLPGSTGALLIASHFTGIPNRANNQRAQDDLFMSVDNLLGRYIPVSQRPNFVVRVFVPEFEKWEQHSGSSFGVRATCRGLTNDKKKKGETEPYWPGMFFNYELPTRQRPEPAVWLAVRARESGQDYKKVRVEQPGWWTLGMSFTPDGWVHYYAKPGVEELTAADRIASHRPYNFQCLYFINVFFDVFSQNDGRSGSTPWVIDDPTVYVANPEMFVAKPRGRTVQRPTPRQN